MADCDTVIVYKMKGVIQMAGMRSVMVGGEGSVKMCAKGMKTGMRNKRKRKQRLIKEAIMKERMLRQSRLDAHEEEYLNEYQEYTENRDSRNRNWED